jgi:hypothetical protein
MQIRPGWLALGIGAAAVLAVVAFASSRGNGNSLPGGACIGGLGPTPFADAANHPSHTAIRTVSTDYDIASIESLTQDAGLRGVPDGAFVVPVGLDKNAGITTDGSLFVTWGDHPGKNAHIEWEAEFHDPSFRGPDNIAAIMARLPAALQAGTVRLTKVTTTVEADPQGTYATPPHFSLSGFAQTFPTKYYLCGAWSVRALPTESHGAISTLDAVGIHIRPGRWVGFSRRSFVIEHISGRQSIVTWYPSATAYLSSQPYVTPVQRTVAPFVLGSTPLFSTTSWQLIPDEVLSPLHLYGGWIVTGKDRNDRPLVVWITAPGNVLHFRDQYLDQGISANQAEKISVRHGLSVQPVNMVALVDPSRPEWYVPAWKTLGGWGYVLVDFRTGQILARSSGVP